MKVLHVINNLGSGGAESMLINFFKELKTTDGIFEILLLVDDKIAYNVPNNITISKLSKSNKRFSFIKLWQLYKFIKINNFDLVHSHLFPSQYYVAFIKLFFIKKLKIITTEHSTSNSRQKNIFFRLIDKNIYKLYDKIIFISNGVAQSFQKIYPKQALKGVVINNGIPLGKFKPAKKISDKSDIFKIIMVARFSKQKDHETLLKALKLLSNNYTLTLVGEGKKLAKIKKLSKSLNIEDRVHFLGFRDDVAKLYQEHDIFVLSSFWEGFGLVVVEAMASGLPIIASNVTGLKEVVRNTGFLFEQGNEKKLAKHIKYIATKEAIKKELIRKGIEKSKLYSIEKLVSETLNLYKK